MKGSLILETQTLGAVPETLCCHEAFPTELVCSEVLLQEGPLGIHFLRVVCLMSVLGAGVLNSGQLSCSCLETTTMCRRLSSESMSAIHEVLALNSEP